MILLILLLFFTSRVNLEMQSMQYRMHVSRKSRSNLKPLETGFVYSQVNENPGTFASFSNEPSAYDSVPVVEPYANGHSDVINTKNGASYSELSKKYGSSPIIKYSDRLSNYKDSSIGKYSDRRTNYNEPAVPKYGDIEKYGEKLSLSIDSPLAGTDEPTQLPLPLEYTDTSGIEPSLSQYYVNNEKGESRWGSNFLPSLINSKHELKSLMHYRPPPDKRIKFGTNTMNDFYIDDDDVRTSSRSTYNNWPYFYHSPYEYEYRKTDTNIQKAKDKRFAVDTTRAVIPVHEEQNDNLNVYNPLVTSSEYAPEMTTPDNPFAGHQPFFSFVLNDYFDKSNSGDPLTFKGMEWGKEFDDESAYSDNDYESENQDYGKRNRRLHDSINYPEAIDRSTSTKKVDNVKASNGESVTEKGYSKNHQFDNHEKGNDQTNSHKTEFTNDGNRYVAFKNFVDRFINKFGSKDLKNDSKYVLKQNQDRGEKKKGFRRVYHKDEYQEDNEFYDNTNHSAKGEEKAGSLVHTGGSGAHLQSYAAADLGNESNAYNNSENTSNKNYENNNTGYDNSNGYDNEFYRYRDVAKKAAKNNNADYTDIYSR